MSIAKRLAISSLSCLIICGDIIYAGIWQGAKGVASYLIAGSSKDAAHTNMDRLFAQNYSAEGHLTPVCSKALRSAENTALWSAGLERGDLTEFTAIGGGGFSAIDNKTGRADPRVKVEVSTEQAHTGTHSIRFEIGGIHPDDYPFLPQAQVQRFTEPALQPAIPTLFYSVWLYFPTNQNFAPRGYPGHGWLNVIQFHSLVPKTGMGRIANAVVLFVENNGTSMRFYLETSPQFGNKLSRWSFPSNIPIARWFNIEMRLKASSGKNGEVQVWQDGEEMVNAKSLNTIAAGHTYQWYVNAYGQYQMPSPLIMYADDFSVSKARINPR
jgi:hypothetical protein